MNTATPATQTVAVSSPGIFAQAVTWLKNEGTIIVNDIKADFNAIEPELIADYDALVGQLTGYGVTAAQEVETAVQDGSLLSSEKRSALTTKLEQQAQTLGYDLEHTGVTSAINFVSEFVVGLLKLLTGTSVTAPVTPPPAPGA